MIPFKLLPFKDSPQYIISGEIHLEVEKLFIKYQIDGNIDEVLFPPPKKDPYRMDDLWKETCFELFLGTPDSSRYFEYNFSPSGDWNCYQFFDYRKDCQKENLSQVPAITRKQEPTKFILSAMVPLPENYRFNKIAGVNVIIQMQDSDTQFWALNHPQEIPDFHDRRGFTLALP